MLFDTHAHMIDPVFDEDRRALLESYPDAGVGLIMNPGCCLESSRQAVELAREFDYVYCAVGSHPDAADEVNEQVLAQYRALARSCHKVKAIGEIGLDYHYEDIPRDIQMRAFLMQLELARELKLPAIVHERDAHADGFAIAREYRDVGGVFHCFSGSGEMARQLVDLGWYIGFTGVLTFKNARKAIEAAQAIPLERIVLETDCPFMAPDPFRGKRNHPGYLYRMAEKLAEIKGVSLEEVHAVTTENGKRLYGI